MKMGIELVLGLGLVFTLALLMVYVTSRGARRHKWEAMDPRLKKFSGKKEVPVTEEDRKYLEKYASLGIVEFGPPDSEGRLVARLAR
jgi:hypothetical protein